jgi:hypothetical protein
MAAREPRNFDDRLKGGRYERQTQRREAAPPPKGKDARPEDGRYKNNSNGTAETTAIRSPRMIEKRWRVGFVWRTAS